ncbi:MAG: TerB N-terminal domain-containing protein [Dehalococcoidia bacterium]
MEALVGIAIVAAVIWWWTQRRNASDQPTASSRRTITPDARESRHQAGSRPSGSSRPVDHADAGQRAWVPPGESVTVQGRVLSGGMLYVGTGLPGVSAYAGAEPALINPKLPGTHRSPDQTGTQMGYWPSYSEISPASRAAYLDWLAAGRPAGAYIGYVFLFFYGIERRALFEAAHREEARSEIPHLVEEVRRLFDLYQDNRSFRGYAGAFLSLAPLLHGTVKVDELTPPLDHSGWEFPIELRLALGSIVKAGEPIPAPWALSWVRTHPEIHLRTPAQRCANEFNELFQLRYRERFGDGLKLRPNKTPLKLSYHPASASLHGVMAFDAGDLPDVCRLTAPVRQLVELAQAVTDELDAYSRWVGRHGDRDSYGAVALLPRALAERRPTDELRHLLDRVEEAIGQEEVGVVRVADIVADFPARRPGSFTAREATAFVEMLERHGVGIAPDLRYSEINLSKHEHAALFRLVDGPQAPGDGYRAATVLLHLGAAVSAADGSVSEEDEQQLERHLEQALQLSDVDRRRLRAHLRWLLVEPPRLAGMKTRLRALQLEHRDLVGRFVLSVAGADGHVSPAEVQVLSRVYTLLELDAEQLHRDLHAFASGPAMAPVVVAPADAAPGHRIPAPPAEDPSDRGVALDEARIAEVLASTREVTHLLTELFEEADDAGEPVDDLTAGEMAEDSEASADILAGLDLSHAQLLRYLARRPRWSRADFDQTAGELGLMPAGAIETINDASFAVCDEPLIEGDDPLEINEIALGELLRDR